VAIPDPFGLVGQVLDGQFRVDGYVGEGGFSVVYRGTHVGLSEPIAIKCLKLPAALGSALVESFVRRFRDESRLHYKLSQGNLHIVRAIASGTIIAPTTSALVPYTVLEWLEGRSLADEFVDRRVRGFRGRPLQEVVRLLDSAVDAVAYAHAQGVVHRDLNPGNLFLAQTPSGLRLKVLDFGVAKILADSALAMSPSARTVGNVRMFAPAYGAPEQFDETVGAIGPWTDVYALALVALEALTDRTVMEGEHLGEFALKALDGVNRPTPRSVGAAVGDDVEAVMARAVAISPASRPRDAGEFWGMLKHAMSVDASSGRAPHATKPPSEPPPPPTFRIPSHVPEGTSPVVEVVRPPSAPPPGVASVARPHAGTLRMAHAPRSGAEALALTPTPLPVSTSTVRLHTPPPPSPVVAPSQAPILPPPVASNASPFAQTALAPIPSANPPPIIYPVSPGIAPPDERPSSGSGALVIVVVVVILGALAGGWYVMSGRSHAQTTAPASSSGG
jgi:serine/threonine-protein kinase